jgi:single-stranded DNA-binding protein
MAYNRAQALKICTAAEMEVFLSSLSDAIGTLTHAQLRSRIARARTLRDKNTDLFRRQASATRATTGTKRGASGDANRRTEQKAQIFAETLTRLEARQSAIEATPAKRAGARVTAKPTRAPAAPAQPKKSAAKRAAVKAVKAAAKPVAKTVKPAAKPVAKTAAAKAAKSAATKSAKAASGKPVVVASPKKKAAPVAKTSLKAPAVKPGNPVSAVVKLRGKIIGTHARSAGARVQARSGKR